LPESWIWNSCPGVGRHDEPGRVPVASRGVGVADGELASAGEVPGVPEGRAVVEAPQPAAETAPTRAATAATRLRMGPL
jgi:hypothetical protein